MIEHLLPLPVCWQFEGSAIRAGIVIRLADIRWIALEGRTPGIADILINPVAITIDLKETGYREVHPLRIVVLQSEKILRCILMVFDKVEFPHALHREIARRFRLVALFGEVFTLESKESCVSLLTVHLIHRRVFPHGSLVGSKALKCHQTSN